MGRGGRGEWLAALRPYCVSASRARHAAVAYASWPRTKYQRTFQVLAFRILCSYLVRWPPFFYQLVGIVWRCDEPGTAVRSRGAVPGATTTRLNPNTNPKPEPKPKPKPKFSNLKHKLKLISKSTGYVQAFAAPCLWRLTSVVCPGLCLCLRTSPC